MLERESKYRSIVIQDKKGQKSKIPFDSILRDFVNFKEKEHLMLTEKLRRGEEIITQARKDHLATTSQHEKAISDLSQKLNTLQPRGNDLYDEQCTEEWRGLRRQLENWVSKSFGNTEALNTMTSNLLISRGLAYVPPEELLETSTHIRRAYIQADISYFIFQKILNALFVQVPDFQVMRAFQIMASHVHNKGK